MTRILLLLVVHALAVLLSQQAVAQDVVAAPDPVACRLCAAPTSTLPGSEAPTRPVRLEVETSLDFDRLVLTGPDGGVAQLRPDGSATSSGALEMSGRGIVGSAVIQGEPGRSVRIELPARIALDGLSGGQILIESLTTDLPTMPRLDSAGRLQFRFGGALRVLGDAEGTYRGDVEITVDYL